MNALGGLLFAALWGFAVFAVAGPEIEKRVPGPAGVVLSLAAALAATVLLLWVFLGR